MDRPIHLAELMICHRDDHTEASVTVPLWITQSTLDGMIELIKFLDGLQRNTGDVPGAFDLVMFYRTLANAIWSADNQARAEAKRVAEIPEGEPTDVNPDYVASHSGTRDRFGRRVLTIDDRRKSEESDG